MKAKLLGAQGIGFTNPNGEEIKGMNIFVAFEDEQVEGMRCERFFLKEGVSLPKETKINDTLELNFNYKGKIISIQKTQ